MPRAAAERWMWLGLALAALLPRAVAAAIRPPWHDEYFTAWASALPWRDLLAALRADSGPPLPYALVKLLALAGLPPLAAARLLAVAAGVAAVVLAARAARRAFGAEAGWWTGALLALHPLAVAWSAEGRAYALVLLGTAWAWDRMTTLAEGGRGAVGLALATALACWSHALGMLLAAALAAAALSLPGPARRRAIAGIAAGLASHLPWLPVAVHQPPAAVAWMVAFWRALPVWQQAVAPVRLLSPAGRFGTTLDLPAPPGWLEVAGAVLVAAVLARGFRREGRPHRVTLALAFPAAALLGLAALGAPALYPGRSEAVYLVPFALLLGAGASGARPRRAAAAALCLGAIAVTGVAIGGWASRPPLPERRLAAVIRERLPRGGRVVIGGYWRLGLAHYLGRDRPRFELVNYPASAASHPGWYDPSVDRPSPGELDDLLAALRPRARETALVVTPGLPTAADLESLGAALGLRPTLSVSGARLLAPPTD